jgi:NAD(P)-dependent dehydrogenase (short-subunit alcohol dehydrogenase family)
MNMKIIVVGSSGAVGNAALQALSVRNEVITANRSSGDYKIDLEDVESIRAMYASVGKVDAVVCAIGHGHFGPVDGMTSEQFMKGIIHKTLPQVNLVLEGLSYMTDGGSFTITSGVLNRDPIRGGASAAAANGALDSFVIGAAVDMPRGIRINVVSPEVLEVSRAKYNGFFHGHVHVSEEDVGLAYCKAVEGCGNGQILIVE